VSKDPAGKTARFIYISDGDNQSAWHARRDRAQVRVGWRLIAANNRPLGRSWVVFDSFEACVDAATLLHDRLGDVTSTAMFDTKQANWYWTVLLDDDPVAVCVHAYRRRVECMKALEQFLVAVRTTTRVADELRNYGPNALSVYDRPRDYLPGVDLVSLATSRVPDPGRAGTLPAVAT
jgi:hypothetical protein